MARYKPRQARNDNMPGEEIIGISEFRSFVLYGRSGTGKTTLVSTWPKPILLLDIKDRGTDSVADIKDLMKRRIRSFEEFKDMFYYLEEHPTKFATVALDTVSQLQQMMMTDMFGTGKRKNKKTVGDWGSMTKRDWGDLAAEMKSWLINYRDLQDMNVIFVAQDRTFNFGEDDDGNDISEIEPEIGPALMPSVARMLNASVEMIGNTFIRNKTTKEEIRGKIRRKEHAQFCLRVGPSPVYITKVRKPRNIEAPSYITNPTYDDIIDIIRGE